MLIFGRHGAVLLCFFSCDSSSIFPHVGLLVGWQSGQINCLIVSTGEKGTLTIKGSQRGRKSCTFFIFKSDLKKYFPYSKPAFQTTQLTNGISTFWINENPAFLIRLRKTDRSVQICMIWYVLVWWKANYMKAVFLFD